MEKKYSRILVVGYVEAHLPVIGVFKHPVVVPEGETAAYSAFVRETGLQSNDFVIYHGSPQNDGSLLIILKPKCVECIRRRFNHLLVEEFRTLSELEYPFEKKLDTLVDEFSSVHPCVAQFEVALNKEGL